MMTSSRRHHHQCTLIPHREMGKGVSLSNPRFPESPSVPMSIIQNSQHPDGLNIQIPHPIFWGKEIPEEISKNIPYLKIKRFLKKYSLPPEHPCIFFPQYGWLPLISLICTHSPFITPNSVQHDYRSPCLNLIFFWGNSQLSLDFFYFSSI